MKRKILLAAICVLFCATAFGVGTVTQSLSKNRADTVAVLTFTWTADVGDASVPSTTTSTAITAALQHYFLYMMETDPGGTAPTDNYDIVVNDANGNDILGGLGADRDTANTETVMPLIGGANYAPRPIDTALTLVITNNAVNSATGVVKLYFAR
jgi:hypothetical protein